MDQKTIVHLHNGILCSGGKKELIPFATAWMELESIMLSEISQTVRDIFNITLNNNAYSECDCSKSYM